MTEFTLQVVECPSTIVVVSNLKVEFEYSTVTSTIQPFQLLLTPTSLDSQASSRSATSTGLDSQAFLRSATTTGLDFRAPSPSATTTGHDVQASSRIVKILEYLK